MQNSAFSGDDHEVARAMLFQDITAERDRLNELSDSEFIKNILSLGNKDEMNIVVQGNRFPAWDIAKRIDDNNWIPTEKQRTAIRNVYLFSKFGMRYGY